MRLIFCFSLFLFPVLIFAQPSDIKQRPVVDYEDKSASTIGKPFPDFSVVTLDGKTVSEQALKGKVTLVNFWFEGCAPCRAELDALCKLYAKYKDNPNVELISFTKDDVEIAKKAVQKYNIPYVVCALPSKECNRLKYEQGSYPTNIIVDRSGNIAYFKSGGYVDKEKVEQYFEEVLKPKILELLAN